MAKLATGVRPTKGGPFVPIAVVNRLIDEPLRQHGVLGVASLARVTSRMIWGWRHGETAWVTFNVADRIIIDVLDEPSLWYLDPELAAVCEEII